jgi:Predicted ATP-dependent protease
MKSKFEIPYEELLNDRYLYTFSFRTTEEIKGFDGLIGQERAEKAMDFGINTSMKGYNIYISGENGMGKFYYAQKTLKSQASKYNTPDDWCCVFNFENEYEPLTLNFRPGIGKIFKHDMEYVLNEIIDRIPLVFNGEEYEKQKDEILEEFHNNKNTLMDDLTEDAASHGIQLKNTSSGIAFTPIIENKPMSEVEYDSLDKSQKELILKDISVIKTKAVDVLRKLKTAEKEADEKVSKLDNEVAEYVIDDLFLSFHQKYAGNEHVVRYFKSVKQDILKNLSIFVNGINVQSMSKEEEEFLRRYRVNLLIDNSETRGAPVVYESNPTYTNLVGNVEYESKLGTVTTDFLKVRAGSILKASGGFLILNVEDVLGNYQSWEALKRVLEIGEVRIEGLRSQLELITITTIKPREIPVSLKVVLIGRREIYELLYELDQEFDELFKVKVDFENDIEKNNENVYKTIQFISGYCSQNNLKHLNASGVNTVLKYSSRLAGSRKKLSGNLQRIVDLINESCIWANLSESRYVGNEHVKKALSEQTKRVCLLEDRILNLFKDKTFMVNVDGKVAGQVNGLSVIESGGYSFGKVCRITASTYMGKGGIINIERETQMSGNIHNKGVMILSGYLGEMYAKSVPLSLTAHICFEQLYGPVDGDSASVAELYALLSSISGVPFKQCIAVTGSLNQKGEVQPVGGINEKIEGFHKVCSLYGFNQRHGVIIPHKNIDDLILNDDVLKDIKNGSFHIYAIKNVDEGIEILTDMKFGDRKDDGRFEKDCFNYCVDEKLKGFIKNYNSLSELGDNNKE